MKAVKAGFHPKAHPDGRAFDPIKAVVKALGGAARTIDATIYKAGNVQVFKALKNAAKKEKNNKKRAVTIRLLVDEQQLVDREYPAAKKVPVPDKSADRTAYKEAKKENRAAEKAVKKEKKEYAILTAFEALDAANKNVTIRIPSGKLHMKMLVVDRTTVVTGSFNWNDSAAQRNTELVLRMVGPEYGEVFYEIFDDLWDQASPWPPTA